MRIAIVGCGSIGSKLAKAADNMKEVKRIYLIDTNREAVEKVAATLKKAIIINNVEEELYHTDLVIEAASQDAVKNILLTVVARGVDIMVMSVGALVDDEFRKLVFDKALVTESRIFIPTGALCGTDGLKAAAIDDIDTVELITTKGPKSMSGVKFLTDQGIKVEDIKEPMVVYSGTAREAVKDFPKNINVAATVSILGIGFDKTKVTVIVDPAIHSNSHELRVKGKFGEMVCHTYNVPEEDNPKTSHLAVLSAISSMQKIVKNDWFGI